MGIPKFYRWISERYPLCSQVVTESGVAEFDNLYLDMNGIIHNCSHNNNDDVTFRISDKQIFSAIFSYLENIFSTIKPKKVFFMAVDGVAPRAKINQQRARRFCKAQEAALNLKKAVESGEPIPKDDAFDSNCITPGTPFMDALSKNLVYFINKKVSTDEDWQKCKIIYSGQEIPGEGEHKIMEYIRNIRSQPDYNPNTRHCLYGLDADLIMLGLVTHEPHFSLLREEVVFSKNKKKQSHQKFFLLHLSLFREYLELEFSSLKTTADFNLERIIDDFIILCLFVGNDFIPNLPGFHINDGALSSIFEVYKLILPKSGYINDSGIINFSNLELILKELVRSLPKNQDQKDLSEGEMKFLNDMHLFLTHSDCNEIIIPKNEKSFGLSLAKELGLSSKTLGKKAFILKTEPMKDPEESPDEESISAQLRVVEKYLKLKDSELTEKKEYYKNKLKLDFEDTKSMDLLKGYYLQGIQWVALYYYCGVKSWSWYYPYHYAPHISDLTDLLSTYSKMAPFSLNTPFTPFEQLLGVLPVGSIKHIPEAFRCLMIEPSSPILDFYPLKFETDLNGKKNDWEAVVLIPFIDERRLLDAMKPYKKLLTKAEKSRDSFGKNLVFEYSRDPTVFKSTRPDEYPDINQNFCICTELIYRPLSDNDKQFKGLMEGVRLGVQSCAGFPSIKHLDHNSTLSKHKVKVFNFPSKDNTMVIYLKPRVSNFDSDILRLLNSVVFVGYPYLTEALVVGVSDCVHKWSFTNGVVEKEESSFENHIYFIKSEYSEKRGVIIGKIDFLIHVKLIKGLKYEDNGSLVKDFTDEESVFAWQTVVLNCEEDPRYKETLAPIVEKEYPIGQRGYYLGKNHYGEAMRVVALSPNKQKLEISLEVMNCEDFHFEMLKKLNEEVVYSFNTASEMLGISFRTLSQLCSMMLIAEDGDKKPNIGLDMKFDKKRLKAIGYTKKINNTWYLSPKALDIIKEYKRKFPEVFKTVERSTSFDYYHKSEIIGDRLKELLEWLKTVKTYKTVSLDCDQLSDSLVAELEQKQNKLKKQVTSLLLDKYILVKDVLLPKHCRNRFLEKQTFEIMDRVVLVSTDLLMDGKHGYVIVIGEMVDGILWISVLLDEPQEFANSLDGLCSDKRGICLPSYNILNLTNKYISDPQKLEKPLPEKSIRSSFNAVPPPEKYEMQKHTVRAQYNSVTRSEKIVVDQKDNNTNSEFLAKNGSKSKTSKKDSSKNNFQSQPHTSNINAKVNWIDVLTRPKSVQETPTVGTIKLKKKKSKESVLIQNAEKSEKTKKDDIMINVVLKFSRNSITSPDKTAEESGGSWGKNPASLTLKHLLKLDSESQS